MSCDFLRLLSPARDFFLLLMRKRDEHAIVQILAKSEEGGALGTHAWNEILLLTPAYLAMHGSQLTSTAF